MEIACCAWSIPGEEISVLTRIGQTGIRILDLRPGTFFSDEITVQMEAMGFRLSCLASAYGIPEGAALDSPDHALQSAAVAYSIDGMATAARRGMKTAYTLPGQDASKARLALYAASVERMADEAQKRGLRLCVEHFPGSALPTISGTLSFIRDVGHPNLYLLIDVGHAQISGEDPAQAIQAAGDRLGYIHLNDNDGKKDLHLALCDGVMTQNTLKSIQASLVDSPYKDPLSLELNPANPEPFSALMRSLSILQSL
jgi:sugar phosphate isomerase/epimerase